ncbi:macro domain-containing protein [Flavobacterium psychrotrophum]|uniref:macro domain-containing protein n=1 Tax=Flavobacterium psychrotrophum TaxID=2294119 RepID=UPI000E31CEA4|nr:macro domain-containing protein [Flavobacterium psychrotrophum]
MPHNLNIKLVHYNTPALGAAWQKHFEFDPNVQIVDANIFDAQCDAIVSPGNSFGFMDGGLDLFISQKYGWDIQAELQRRIKQLSLNELLVGQTEIMQSRSGKFIVCAPTMRVPGSQQIPESVNAYLAMKGILSARISHPEINSVAVPGLCTGTGKMPFNVAANQMFMAYKEIVKKEVPEFPLFIDAVKHHQSLKTNKEFL